MTIIYFLLVQQKQQSMLAKHKKLKTLTNRSNIQMSPIQMCNFLFKKVIPIPQFNRNDSNDKYHMHNQSLHLRLKSQISSNKKQSKMFNIKTAANSRAMKATSLDLTCRVLKWNHLKNKKQNHIDKNTLYNLSKRGQPNEENQINRSNRSNNVRIKYKKPQITHFQPPRIRISKKNRLDSLRLSQNYKETKRIVFIEQLQQKKEKQRMIYHHQHSPKRFISQISPQKAEVEDKGYSQVVPSVMCRPWSGESANSNHH